MTVCEATERVSVNDKTDNSSMVIYPIKEEGHRPDDDTPSGA